MARIEYRLVERDAFCRGCQKELKRNTDKAIMWYAPNNRGMNIIICPDCVELIYNLVKGNSNEH